MSERRIYGEYHSMSSASTIRTQIEAALSKKIPSALTPQPKTIRPQVPTGIPVLDDLLGGGLPIGAVTELVGAECTGRTSVALSVLARVTEASRVCAWIDTSNALDPVSAAASGVDLNRLLWVRCGGDDATATTSSGSFSLPPKYLIPATPKKGLHGGSFGPHPRTEVRGLSEAMTSLFRTEPKPPHQVKEKTIQPPPSRMRSELGAWAKPRQSRRRAKHYDAIERALRTTDLLLQTGGFSAIVLDLAGIRAEYVARIELSTWHRYRMAAEKMQACILLLTQYPCAKSGSELQLHLSSADLVADETTVFCGMQPHIEIHRQRFTQPTRNVIPLRKPPQGVRTASWQSRTSWAGVR